MLEAFEFTNFKSFRDKATLPLAPLTVLIGANASGKSNAIEAIRLLSWLGQGNNLSTIQNAIQESNRVVRGRIEDLAHREADEFTLGCRMGFSDSSNWAQLSVSIESRNDGLHIIHESTTMMPAAISLYETRKASVGDSTKIRVSHRVRGAKKRGDFIYSDQNLIAAQFILPASSEVRAINTMGDLQALTMVVRIFFGHSVFIDPMPSRMRNYAFLSDFKLHGEGANLSSILFYLWDRDNVKAQANRSAILDFIRSLPEQDISGLDFLRGPRGEVMVELKETFGGVERSYDASLLSDGTLRVLAVAAAMLSAPEGGMVVIEEIDNGVHPSRAHHLLANIRAIAERRQLRVLLTTHNPAVLDALPDAAVPDVVFCYRDPKDGSSRLVRLQDVPDYPELIAQGSLGHLLTTGILDRFVKTYAGPEERKRQALAWLEQLEAANQGGAP